MKVLNHLIFGIYNNMPIKFQKFIKRQDLKDNPDQYYVFGDNDNRTGIGGQAKEMRGEPNAIGIRTKKLASHNEDAYYYDTNYLNNTVKIVADFKIVHSLLMLGRVVVFPADGIGTGLAKLGEKAPLTLKLITNIIEELVEKYGEIK